MSEEILVMPKKRGRPRTGRKVLTIGVSLSREIYERAKKIAHHITETDEFKREYNVQDIVRKGFLMYLDTFKMEDIEASASKEDEGQLSLFAS